MIEGKKVVEANEMARIEKLAYGAGFSEIQFMENAGKAIASSLEQFIKKHQLKKEITLLVGKGNNGGDAFAAGKLLLKQGYEVQAVHLFPSDACSSLCLKQRDLFQAAGGHIQTITERGKIKFSKEGVILDGIFGTGFQGQAEGVVEDAIQAANHSGLPIISIDIPSAVNGNTGEVGGSAIHADATIALGLPKIGCFIGAGWNHVGTLMHGDFGLEDQFIQQAAAKAFISDTQQLFGQLPPIKRNRHKYQKGYVLALAGSSGMAGAAILASHAALRSGAGMLRLFYPEEMEEEMNAGPLELIKEGWDFQNFTQLFNECKRAHAMLIGPGLGRGAAARKMLKKLFANLHLPCVVDADALYLMSGADWELPEQCILTPHRKEAERLLGIKPAALLEEQKFHDLCQKYADEKKVTLVLKGGPTFIFHPQSAPLIVLEGTPGLATAGSGDVLTGVIAACLSQHLDTRTAAALGVAIHGLAGEIAAKEKSVYSMMASDVIECLPQVFLNKTLD